MFTKVISGGSIPPNFLNSILTNPSLYEMFKNDYENNVEYFQGIEKNTYLSEMLNFIENSLFSSNLFNIYIEPDDLEEKTTGKLSFIKNFYDDFLLEEFRQDPETILKTKFFRGMVYAKNEDLYANKTPEFNGLFDYIFKESIDYEGIVEVLIKEPTRKLSEDETLSLKEFDTLCNYVKNNIDGFVPMSIVTKMLKNHAYKSNHIFDRTVIEILIRSTAKSYLLDYDIDVDIEFASTLELEERGSISIDPNIVTLEEQLLDEFLSLNYTSIFTVLFMELEKLKSRILLRRNKVDCATLRTIMGLVTSKVDLTRIFEDETYQPMEYLLDLEASCFIKTLRFFSTSGVNLFQNYINSEVPKLNLEGYEASLNSYSYKEVSLDQRFFEAFKKRDDRLLLIKRYAVLGVLYDSEGKKRSTLSLIKRHMKSDHRVFLEEYLNSRIDTPEAMIDDVAELANYKSTIEDTRSLIERELKYIYTDTFYYSLDSYLKFKSSPRFDKDDYLTDLAIKVNCIKDTPLTHRFIDEALFTIEEAKQNTDSSI